MGVEELSAGDKEVVGMSLKFVDKSPTKGLFRVYNSGHPIIDIEGHMAQSGKKNLALFQSLRKEMATKAKAAGKVYVPNLQESVVELHVHGETKKKAELPPQPGKGKDVKKIRAALLGTASGAGSASGEKGPEAGLIELSEISVRKDISIDVPDTVVNSIDNMDADHIVRTMVEFGSKALVLSRRVGSLYRREVKEVEELQGKVDKLEEEKAALEKEKEGWEAERKRLATIIIIIYDPCVWGTTMDTHYQGPWDYVPTTEHNTQNQASIIHTKPGKQSHIALPRPAPRLGWRVSLRRDMLAQARHARSSKSPSLRRGLEKASGKPRGISLRRDPSRLGEILARSKFMSGSPRRPLA
ncbi:hypothetical protein DEO72_LG8g2001 [Vigna unguiculata]|uniref:Uncharacterized protein n=1 Tax=Vigna unguiculata TaxID=3917 RepID=A0A4D6MV38_VIGUN|nr:hypothetical protein DEO72_LG8g2001 [Vigna unguiculata]